MRKAKFLSLLMVPQVIVSFMAATVTVAALGSAVVLQQVPQIADLRNQACLSCGSGSCPDGFQYGADTCSHFSDCTKRAEEACRNHGGGQGTGGGPTAGGTSPAPANAQTCDSDPLTARECRGKAVNTRIGGTCTCRRTTGTLCGCMAEGVKCENNGGTCLKPEGKSCNQHNRLGSPGGECGEGTICCGALLDGTGGGDKAPAPTKAAKPTAKPTIAPTKTTDKSIDKTPLAGGAATSCVVNRLYCRQGDIMKCTQASGVYKLDEECGTNGCSTVTAKCRETAATTGTVATGGIGPCVAAGGTAKSTDRCCTGSIKCPGLTTSSFICKLSSSCYEEGEDTETPQIIRVPDNECSRTSTNQGRDGCKTNTARFDISCSSRYRCGEQVVAKEIDVVPPQVQTNGKNLFKRCYDPSTCTDGLVYAVDNCRPGETVIPPLECRNLSPNVPTVHCYSQDDRGYCHHKEVVGTTCPSRWSRTNPPDCANRRVVANPPTITCYAPGPVCRPVVTDRRECPAGMTLTPPAVCTQEAEREDTPPEVGDNPNGCLGRCVRSGTSESSCRAYCAEGTLDVPVPDRTQPERTAPPAVPEPPAEPEFVDATTCINRCIGNGGNVDSCANTCRLLTDPRQGDASTEDEALSYCRSYDKDKDRCVSMGCLFADPECLPQTVMAEVRIDPIDDAEPEEEAEDQTLLREVMNVVRFVRAEELYTTALSLLIQPVADFLRGK